MFEILQYDFIQNALIAGILISIAAGIIGTLVVVNKITFLTGGIAHSAYGGIGIAIFLGIPVLFGATIFSVLTAIIIAIITLKNRSRIDAIIGMMWEFLLYTMIILKTMPKKLFRQVLTTIDQKLRSLKDLWLKQNLILFL